MNAAAVLGAAALLALAGCGQPGGDHHAHRFDGAEKWARIFDDPARDAWQKPAEVIRTLRLSANATVADLGAGTGYFAVRLARAVPAGRVYGVDTEPDMVRYLGERAQRERLANVTPVQAEAREPKLPVAVDLVLVVNTYHHIPSRVEYLRQLKTALKPGGRIAIIDFLEEAPMGPPRRARIPARAVVDEFGRAGYALVERHDFLPHQYFLVFTAKAG